MLLLWCCDVVCCGGGGQLRCAVAGPAPSRVRCITPRPATHRTTAASRGLVIMGHIMLSTSTSLYLQGNHLYIYAIFYVHKVRLVGWRGRPGPARE